LFQVTVFDLAAQPVKERKKTDSICQKILLDKSLQKKVFSNEEFMEQSTDNGAELTIYYKNNKVYRITEWIGLSNKVIISNYYFINNKLIFVKDEEYMFEHDPKTGEILSKLSKEDLFIGTYYFNNKKLVDQESLGHNRFEDERNDPEKEFLYSSVKYLKLFYRK